jgi:WD40 repeat protein
VSEKSKIFFSKKIKKLTKKAIYSEKKRLNTSSFVSGLGTFILIVVFKKVWAGSKDGKLSIFCIKSFEREKSFVAHADTIRSLCFVEKYIVSGSGSKDGTIAVWHASRINRSDISTSIQKMLAKNFPK